MPNHSEPNQTRLRAGRLAGQVEHHTHQLPQRHTAVVYPTPLTSTQIYQPVAMAGLFFLGVVLLALFGVAFLVALLLKRRPALFRLRFAPRFETKRPLPAEPVGRYRLAPSLLTPTEAAFYAQLRTATGPLAVIQCKVRLADILLAPEHDLRAFRRVSQKHLDFLLCERVTLRPLLAVELDDPSHARLDRQLRDLFVDSAYAQAGLPVVHVAAQSTYSPAALLALIQPHLVSSSVSSLP